MRTRHLVQSFVATAFVSSLFLSSRPSDAKGLDATRISLPKGPGSVEGLGKNFTPSLASGTASYGVDIAVPPAAAGFAPKLSLDYDSGGGISDLGIGWQLGGVAEIRRRTENGLPKLDGTDAFEIAGFGAPSDLLEIATNVFRPQYESGSFVRVQRSTDGKTCASSSTSTATLSSTRGRPTAATADSNASSTTTSRPRRATSSSSSTSRGPTRTRGSRPASRRSSKTASLRPTSSTEARSFVATS
ncbi:MAG: hypothetical protein HYV09_13055 [Deltaproteobacteria bacterium]|nr:hypothetical protein [Deltaproteobacteria bacterium]